MNPAAWQERGGAAWRAAFALPALAYGAAVRARARAYERGWLETVRVPVPVFCVGNLSVGGTGKTPAVAWLARHLKTRGRRPAVITRGYGRRAETEVAVVSDGARALLDAPESGDEPLLLAAALPGVPVVAGADRAAAARRALEDFGSDCLVMDDGFQHHRLHRDLDLVCVDAWEDASLFSDSSARWLLPAGRLREPLDGLRRAGVVFLTKADLRRRDEIMLLAESVRRVSPDAVVAAVRYDLTFREEPGGKDLPPESLRDKPVLALTGLARPGAFEESLRRLGARVISRRFPDHHFFTPAERDEALRRARAEGGLLVVTEKDRVRLPPDFPAVTARLVWRPDENAASAVLARIDACIS